MYALVKTGSKQYKVQVGDEVKVEKLYAEVGDKVELDTVLAVSDESGLKVGRPLVEGAKVVASVLEQGKAKKVVIFKYLPKKDHRKKKGHRQPYTKLKIEEILV